MKGFHFLDSLPVQMQFLGNILNGSSPATTPDEISKAFGVKRIICQPRKSFLLHLVATPAQHAPNIEVQIDPPGAAGKVSNLAQLVVVE